MNSLFCEVVFCILFLYFGISTFIAELLSGVMQSFLCVFGFSTLNNSPIAGFPLLYYSYVIILSIVGNVMFLVSLLIYGPKLFRTQTQFVERRQTEKGVTEVVSPHNQIIFCSRRRFSHICIFTRYDMYATLVLFFISIQFFLRTFVGTDDFKEIEGMLFRRTILRFDRNFSESNCLDEWCDRLDGHQALKNIHEWQQQKQCCGWEAPNDWIVAATALKARQNKTLPDSCCYGLAPNCSVANDLRFSSGCIEFGLPVRPIIDPTQYSDHCFGIYPVFKLLAVICYQFSFSKIFDGSALLLKVNLFFSSNIRII